MRPTTIRRALGAILITGLLLGGLYWLFSPPLKITVKANVAKIDLQNLGEYNSALNEIVISDLTDHRVIWHAKPKKDFIAVLNILIHVGSNPTDLGLLKSDPDIDVVVPPHGSAVEFVSGHRYRVEIRGEPLFWGLHFALPVRHEFTM